jgi:heat shock protein beta
MRINVLFILIALLLSCFVFAKQEEQEGVIENDELIQQIQEAGDHEIYTFQVRP